MPMTFPSKLSRPVATGTTEQPSQATAPGYGNPCVHHMALPYGQTCSMHAATLLAFIGSAHFINTRMFLRSRQQAAQGFGQVASLAQRGSQLADIYGQTPYGQQQAQSEVFNLAGQTDAANQRKKLTALEQAQFAGQGGTATNSFSRERAMSPMMLGVPGAGSF